MIYACTTLQIAWCINHCFLSHEWRDRDVPQVEVVENASSLFVLHTCWPVHIHSSRFLAVASQRHAVVWSCRAVALPLCEAAVARCCRYNNGNNGNNGISVANNGTSLLQAKLCITSSWDSNNVQYPVLYKNFISERRTLTVLTVLHMHCWCHKFPIFVHNTS